MWPFSSNAALIKSHVAKRDALIVEASKTLGHAHSQAQAILSSSIEEIVAGIEKKKWTSTIVVETFIRQAILAHKETNCLTEVNFREALERANLLDAEFAKSGKLVGPLHGVPFSLKDHFDLAGKHSSTGYSEWLKQDPRKSDGALARIAMHYGAICIAKTNVPQTMLTFETRNPVWGQTNNPYSKLHTCGGSSGGEAALLAANGAAFGFGR